LDTLLSKCQGSQACVLLKYATKKEGIFVSASGSDLFPLQMGTAEQGLGGLYTKLLLIHGRGDLKRLFEQAEKIAFGHPGGFGERFNRQRFRVVAFDIAFCLVDAVVLSFRD
jgi:hypothetical protein